MKTLLDVSERSIVQEREPCTNVMRHILSWQLRHPTSPPNNHHTTKKKCHYFSVSAFAVGKKISVEKNSGTPSACRSTGLRHSKKKKLLNGWTLICTLVVSGQWKQCSDRLMKIEMLNAAKRDTLKRGSLFHEIGSVTQPTQKPPGTLFYAFMLPLHTQAPHFFFKQTKKPQQLYFVFTDQIWSNLNITIQNWHNFKCNHLENY